MGGFRLGSVLGMEIRIDYSWFVIFFLILWTLTLNVFPASYPGMADSTYAVMGLTATLLFFSSIVVHELSHSVVAQARGIPVAGITLFIFGGMAHTRMESETPGDEFAIAVAGPIASFAIAAFFWMVAWLGQQAGWPMAVIGVATYLAFINLVLAIFNLFPGFPLDGGRIFRSAVWKYTGSLRRATRYAAAGGKLFGALLIVLGLLNLFAGNLIGGMWFILIGWFLRMAAGASYAHHILRRTLQGVRVGDAMTPDPQTVTPDLPIRQFVEDFVFDGRHHSYPVVADGRPLGIITLDRIKGIPRQEWEDRNVADAMLPAADDALVQAEEPMQDVMEKLMGSKISRVLVMQNGELVGILTHTDIARWLQRAQLLEQD
jgi:Zn-dependent protease